MGFFSRDKGKRFVGAEAHRRNLENQTQMSPGTVAQLHGVCVQKGASLALQYFFYTDANAKGETLARALSAKHYSAECHPAADGGPLFCITGWSTPVSIEDKSVVAWTREMCELGFEHDAEFDGWGTSPP
jgi:hypothetical protein